MNTARQRGRLVASHISNGSSLLGWSSLHLPPVPQQSSHKVVMQKSPWRPPGTTSYVLMLNWQQLYSVGRKRKNFHPLYGSLGMGLKKQSWWKVLYSYVEQNQVLIYWWYQFCFQIMLSSFSHMHSSSCEAEYHAKIQCKAHIAISVIWFLNKLILWDFSYVNY